MNQPTPYVEKPGQAHYNQHQQQQYTQQPIYSDQQNPYSYQQPQSYPEQQQQQQYEAQPQMVYVQPQRPPPPKDHTSCLPCACLVACCWATFCWPCLCCL